MADRSGGERRGRSGTKGRRGKMEEEEAGDRENKKWTGEEKRGSLLIIPSFSSP